METDTTPAPTDEEIVDVLRTAGVEFMRFTGGISGTRDVWTTSGSQDVKDIANGVRAAIARWGAQPAASPAPVVAREPLTVDDLAQEIRRVDGAHSLGAGALAEALIPWLRARCLTSKEGDTKC